MMWHIGKRALSLLLATLLCLTLFPGAALAEEGSIQPAEDEEGGLPETPAREEEERGIIIGDGGLDVPSDDPAALPSEPAEDEIQAFSGSFGENLTWTLDDAGLLTISGDGSMPDWNSYSQVPWYGRRKNIKEVRIQEGVTSIGGFAFYLCSSMTSVTIPAGVTDIGASAFRECVSLTSVTVPAGVRSIGYAAFEDCIRLTSVTIQSGLMSIGDMAFAYCKRLTSVTIPEGVTSIGGNAFSCCSSLTNITLPEGLTSIGGNAFRECSSLKSVVIPAGLISLGDYAFYECSGLTSVTILEGLTEIGDSAFSDCSSLKNLSLPESLTTIWSDAFSGCSSLINLTIPGSVSSIKVSAFSGCSSLTSVTIPASMNSIGAFAFYNCSSLSSVTILEGVTVIWGYAFGGTSLTNVMIPASVNSLGDAVFYECSRLQEIRVADGNKAYASANGVLYDAGIQTLLQCPGGKSGTLAIPESVTSIGGFAAYNCRGLTGVTIPASVTSIGESAFDKCSGLLAVTIPASVTSIGGSAFGHCSGLKSILFPGDAPMIESDAFSACRATAVYPIDNGTWTAGKRQNYGAEKLTWVSFRDTAAAYTIHFDPNGGSNAPEDQVKGHNVDILLTEDVPSRANVSFLGWSTQRAAADPEYLPGDSFGLNADTTLYAVWEEFQPGEIIVDSGACGENLTWTLDDAGVLTISGVGAMTNWSNGDSPWYDQRMNIREIRINAGVNSIGNYAFAGCTNLESVLFQGNAPAFGSNAFSHACAAALYPIDNSTWTSGKRQNYGGSLTWVGYRDVAAAYAVHFDPNGGSNAPEDQIKGHNVDLLLTEAVPSRTGVRFLGWGTHRWTREPEYLPGDSFSLNADTTLYAVWEGNVEILPTEARLTLGSAKTCVGGEFTVKLTMEKNPGVTYLSFLLNYDADALEFLGVEELAFTGWTVNTDDGSLIWDHDRDRAENGVLLCLRFRAKDTIETGETGISIVNLFAANSAADILGIGTAPGIVTILPHLPGDVNGDGAVDGEDLIRLRNYLADFSGAEIVDGNANVNGDGTVDILDLIRLRKYLAFVDVILE